VSDKQDKRAKDYLKPPFRYRVGYIYDANDKMVADQDGRRVRGWGRIQYQPEPEQLQDAIGERVARILSEHWDSQTAAGAPDELSALVKASEEMLDAHNIGDPVKVIWGEQPPIPTGKDQ